MSEENTDRQATAVPTPGGKHELQIGDITVGTPLVLAPMAGVTNPPFRQLVREEAEAGARAAGYDPAAQLAKRNATPGTFAPAGLFVCEMITSRALVERREVSLRMIAPDPGDPVRSIQIYGVSPKMTGRAVHMLVSENRVDHIDLNFGCPMPKVTRKGGGAALPWKTDLLRQVLEESVRAAREASQDRDFTIPVTAKFRIGVDSQHETFRDLVHIAEDAGISALTMHARTCTQRYSADAQWDRLAELAAMTELPVIGNGDIFEAADALAMMEQTGVAGVAVARGAQGRPWLFYDIAAALHGSSARKRPGLAEVAAQIMRHAKLAVRHFGNEEQAMRHMRGHMANYMHGYSVGGPARHALSLVSSLADLENIFATLDLSQPFPDAAEGRRGRGGTEKPAALPEGWLDSRELSPAQAAKIASGEIEVAEA